MAMMFTQEIKTKVSGSSIRFDSEAELKKHAWRPFINVMEAEALLKGKPPYTYLTRPNPIGRGFYITFVNANGHVEHDPFTLIDPIYGIWRNTHPSHVGKLEKVICDMMECEAHQIWSL